MGKLARLIVGVSVLSAATGAAADMLAATTPFKMSEVAPGEHVRRGVDEDVSKANDDGIANIGFIVGRDAVAVIDPGGSRGDGERLKASIAATTKLPIKYVIMTHGHPDHIFGCVAFEGDHPIFVGHERLPGMLAERGAFYRQHLSDVLGAERAGNYAVPTLLVGDRKQIDLGGRVLDLEAHGAAHTDSDITVFDQQTRTLWTGDLLFVGRVPALDGSLTGWLNQLDAMKSFSAALAVPGHGPVSVAWPGALADERHYLDILARDTRAIIAKGGDIETATKTVAVSERDKWALFDDYNGRNVTEAFRELEWE